MTRGHLIRGNSSTVQEKGFVIDDTQSLRISPVSRSVKRGAPLRRGPVPPLLILKTKDLQHDYAQSRANNILIRKVAEIRELATSEVV